jgi:hypothetical protein
MLRGMSGPTRFALQLLEQILVLQLNRWRDAVLLPLPNPLTVRRPIAFEEAQALRERRWADVIDDES